MGLHYGMSFNLANERDHLIMISKRKSQMIYVGFATTIPLLRELYYVMGRLVQYFLIGISKNGGCQMN